MLSRVRLELARTQDHPEGARDVGYEFTAPLDASGHIDHDQWLKARSLCRVRRFRPDQDDEVGHLVRKPGGSWAFHYDVHGNPDDDESGYRLGQHLFKKDEYISIREDDEFMPYKIVSVTRLPA
jgi:hypothetical protein